MLTIMKAVNLTWKARDRVIIIIITIGNRRLIEEQILTMMQWLKVEKEANTILVTWATQLRKLKELIVVREELELLDSRLPLTGTQKRRVISYYRLLMEECKVNSTKSIWGLRTILTQINSNSRQLMLHRVLSLLSCLTRRCRSSQLGMGPHRKLDQAILWVALNGTCWPCFLSSNSN